MKLIREAIIEHYGERCPVRDASCVCCQAWDEYDFLLNAVMQDTQSITTEASTQAICGAVWKKKGDWE